MIHLNDLNPLSQVSAVILGSTGSVSEVNAAVPFKIYSTSSSDFYSSEFLSGASDQVAYTYKKLGGDILDIEIKNDNVYANYEEACLEYSYIVNLHQAKNVMSRVIGSTTGTFDHLGTLQSGSFKLSLSGSHAGLKYPRFSFDYANDIMKGISAQVPIGGSITEYSASLDVVLDQQEYDLQSIVRNLASSGTFGPYFNPGNKKIKITKVYYLTAQAAWRFFGQYGMGGVSVLGNLSNYSGYGQWSDDSTWEVVPVWQNIAQAQAYKEAINVRCSKYSYEINGNSLKLYPTPQIYSPSQFWFRFVVEEGDVWNESYELDGTIFGSGIDGINNLNSLPFEVIPYNNINSIGKNWIRNFCFQLSLETLGRVRSKFDPIPIPGNNITLDGKDLLASSKEKQESLRKELFDILDQLTYNELAKLDAELLDSNASMAMKVPNLIFIG